MRAPALAGGSRADELHLPGVASSALRLSPVAAGLVVEALAAGVRAAGHALTPGARRLLRGGERVEVQGASLLVEPAPAGGGATRVAAAALLREAAAGDEVSGPHLVVLSGPAAGARHVLGPEQTVGRGRGATIRIADPEASRVHARVRVGARGATIEDLRSKNGVRVNGIPVERRPVPLAAGAEITIGETVLALVDRRADAAPRRAPRRGGSGAPVHGRPGTSAPRRPLPAQALAALLLALSAAALALAGS